MSDMSDMGDRRAPDDPTAVNDSGTDDDPGAVSDPRSPVERDLRSPHPSRLAPDDPWRARILEAHDASLDHEEDGYLDPRTGWWVFNAAHLAARKSCCDNGCRHCPYV